MGQCMTQKILANRLERESLPIGEICLFPADVVMTHEVGTMGTKTVMQKLQVERLAPGIEVVVLSDHFVPAQSLTHAISQKITRDFAREWNIENYYEIGRAGIAHQVMHEKGHIRPGEIVVATDAHATMYGALGCLGLGVGVTDMAILLASGKIWLKVPNVIAVILEGRFREGVSAKDLAIKLLHDIPSEYREYWVVEFIGPGVAWLSLDDRFCLCNMLSEGGVKSCLVAPDAQADRYVKTRSSKAYTLVVPDEDAVYQHQITVDLSGVEPMVALPDLPTNGVPVDHVRGVKIDQAFVGSCTNGRIEDLRRSASIIKGKEPHPRVRFIVTPASREVWLQALQEGLLEIFTESGAVITNATCGTCIGAHGMLAPGEVCISSSNRNFKGRMGSLDAKIYLASPETVTLSAIAGEIVASSTPPCTRGADGKK